MIAACNEEVNPAVVVKIAEYPLNGQTRNLNAGSLCDVGKYTRAVVFQQLRSNIVVGHNAIKIAVIVNISKICRPALCADAQAGGIGNILGVGAVAVVEEQLIDPARIVGVIDALPALGNVEIEVAIVVNVRLN